MAKTDNAWLMDYNEIVAFGGALLDTGDVFDTATDLQYFYEKPHKWGREYQSWLLAGKPTGPEAAGEWYAGFKGFQKLGHG